MTIGGNVSGICPACKVFFIGLGAHARYSKTCTKESRFWAQVDRRGPDECWLWQGRKDASGYGRIDRKGPYVYAHRCAWIFTNGHVPAGMDILHRCDIRACCNPAHYFLGTQTDNNRDAVAKGRNTRGERGKHKLTEAQVIEIRKSYQRGVGRRPGNIEQLAERYGVRRQTITNAALGHTWSHVRDGDNGSPE